jgi:hypothetical protein
MNKELSKAKLKILNEKFKDIITEGRITQTPPLPEEVLEKEHLDKPRICLRFNFHDYGRLLEMIHFINENGV